MSSLCVNAKIDGFSSSMQYVQTRTVDHYVDFCHNVVPLLFTKNIFSRNAHTDCHKYVHSCKKEERARIKVKAKARVYVNLRVGLWVNLRLRLEPRLKLS